MNTPFLAVVPMCGDLNGFAFPSRPEALVESGPVMNLSVWEEAATARGCKTPRDVRRFEYALADAFKSVRIKDSSVLDLLWALLEQAPDTPYSRLITEVRLEWESLCCEDRSLTSDEKKGWSVLSRLMELKVDPRDYSRDDAYKLMCDWQLSKLIAKYPFKGAKFAADCAAVDKFLSQELMNAQTNERWVNPYQSFDVHDVRIIRRVQDRLAQILGPAPTSEEVLSMSEWGPGTVAGYSFSSEETGPEFKFAARQTYSSGLSDPKVRDAVVSISNPRWSTYLKSTFGQEYWAIPVPGDILFTVLKEFKVSRCATSVPSLNAWCQRGVGNIIRRNVRTSSGIDLDYQHAVNKEFARIGAATGIFSTLDAISASDSVCRNPVKFLVSNAWATILLSTASKSVQLPAWFVQDLSGEKVLHSYEMLAPMGCGFTFEFESALFLAVCQAVVPPCLTRTGKPYWNKHVGVYGDDIIVPSAYAAEVTRVLQLLGIRINPAKSFCGKEPGFRESCGGDFFHGIPVRPLTITKALDCGQQVVRLANRVLECSQVLREGFHGPSGHGFRLYANLYSAVVGVIPSGMQKLIRGPWYTLGCLWTDKPGRGTPDTMEGQPVRWKTLRPPSDKYDLTHKSFWLWEESGRSGWMAPLSGDNLLNARLSGGGTPMRDTLYAPGAVIAHWSSRLNDSEIMDWRREVVCLDRRVVEAVGHGNYTTLRSNDVPPVKVAYTSCFASWRWAGWATI